MERSDQNFNKIGPQQAWYLDMEYRKENVYSCRDKLSGWCEYNKEIKRKTWQLCSSIEELANVISRVQILNGPNNNWCAWLCPEWLKGQSGKIEL